MILIHVSGDGALARPGRHHPRLRNRKGLDMATATETQTQSYSAGAEVDATNNPTAQKLLKRCQDFFAEVENLYVSAS